MPFMEALFYLILASQIFLLSYHYPMVIVKRYEYIFKHYPAAKYPKFYASSIYKDPEQVSRNRLQFFKYLNFAIVLIGILIVITAIATGFRLNEKGGTELYVVFYFMLQFIPHLLLELHLKKHHRYMREAFANQKRTAELTPRNLFNFISPFWVLFATAIFIFSTFLFLYYEGFDKTWGDEVYITLVGSTAINVAFAFIIYKFIIGKKIDPHLAYKDQLLIIKSVTHNLIFASIMMSLFFIIINSVREYGLDKWEPILMSVYFQIIVILGLGQQLRSIKIEEVDFEVYREEASA